MKHLFPMGHASIVNGRTVPFATSVLLKRGSMAKQSAKKRTGNGPRYKFSVYIASPTRESQLALARLRKICDEQIPKEYEIEVFDLRKRPELATRYDIVATPAIFRTLPAPLRKSIGDLSKTEKALLGLDLLQAE